MRSVGHAAGIAVAFLALTACAERRDDVSDHRLTGARNFVSGYPSVNADGSVNAVIEIPAGTTAKWETLHDGTAIEWEVEAGGRRVVRYLPYPGNYGMVPGTLLPKEAGGDGDPLDVVVLGDALARGSVVAVRLVGVLRLLDDGEQDDKLVAVVPGGPLGDARDLADLERRYPGVREILETWFTHYKGPGRIESLGYEEASAAKRILRHATEAYRADAAP